ncbi:protein-lysine methyltransferase METTL21C-like [Scleropages formosus]|uniref:Protein-lysine methyltransferase METTL21C-like n=1 Tax=Scleropages formosus TaxID=113540 RepID=A0A0P7WVF3_SCLFO|nr:protein-lysine methyltransferase METTL21C-like [Scleropages formosus]
METARTVSDRDQEASLTREEVEEEEEDNEAEREEGLQSTEDTKPLQKNEAWKPNVYCALPKDQYYFVGRNISIYESIDSYGAIVWPAAVALCQFLENNRKQINLEDKWVLEIGAGTGLLSIVASLLGAWVTATDIPDMLGNLSCNLHRNTRGYSKYTPQVAPLCWEQDLEQTYPRSVYRYDYVLAADVVYLHNFLDPLLVTMRHFCQPGTTLIWANKVRFQSDLQFTDTFKSTFNTTLLTEVPEENVKIFMATNRE